MNNFQRDQIWLLRKQGFGYGAVAKAVGLSKSSVKKYCKRHPELKGYGNLPKLMIEERVRNGTHCPQCFQPMLIKSTGRPKIFCSDRCRVTCWRDHQQVPDVSNTAYQELTCQNCGRSFFAYANPKRKYCSHDCYVDYRFRKGGHNDQTTNYGD